MAEAGHKLIRRGATALVLAAGGIWWAMHLIGGIARALVGLIDLLILGLSQL